MYQRCNDGSSGLSHVSSELALSLAGATVSGEASTGLPAVVTAISSRVSPATLACGTDKQYSGHRPGFEPRR